MTHSNVNQGLTSYLSYYATPHTAEKHVARSEFFRGGLWLRHRELAPKGVLQFTGDLNAAPLRSSTGGTGGQVSSGSSTGGTVRRKKLVAIIINSIT